MKKGRYQSQKSGSSPLVWILLFITLLAVCVSIWAVFLRPGSSAPGEAIAAPVQTESIVKNPDSISIPGYEAITLKADALEQILSFKNPAQNVCYFKMTLLLEDGTVLWESGYVEPGGTSDPVVLTRVLEKGSYPNSILKYQCFTLDEAKSPLNGAETKLTLRVK